MRIILNSPWFCWLIIGIPGIAMANGYVGGHLDAMEMLHPTGEWAVRFMVLAMMIGPLGSLFGPRPGVRWLLARRRWLGFASFLYALAHLAFYVVDMGTLDDILGEITEHGIWTGWAALLLMAVPGVTSSDRAMRALRRGWKQAQRLAYPAALLSAAHWVLLEMKWGPAIAHFAPLLALNLIRMFRSTLKESVA